MDRRKFLKYLGVGTATAAVVVVAPELVEHAIGMGPVDEPYMFAYGHGTEVAHISEYADYSDFSELAIHESMDDIVAEAAKELAYRASLTMNQLWEATLA